MMSWDIQTADDQFLIDLSEKAREEAKKEEPGRHPLFSRRVFQISEHVAVKLGYVTASEIAMQKFAYEHLDPRVVRVPKVYRFLTQQSSQGSNRDTAYLFMEYIPGQTLESLNFPNEDIVPQVANIVQHLQQIHGSDPSRLGPIEGYELRGYLWGDDGTQTEIHSIADMNHWLNKRLVLRDLSIDLSGHPLVLCHMDLCRRNLIMPEDGGSLYLVDWGHAGFFPRFFEPATFACFGQESMAWSNSLLRATDSLIHLTEEERRLIKLMHIARAASLRYLFENTKPTDLRALLGKKDQKRPVSGSERDQGQTETDK